jgi:FKBP-type peptidyl-prolyl cis-trans isomerase FkpA
MRMFQARLAWPLIVLLCAACYDQDGTKTPAPAAAVPPPTELQIVDLAPGGGAAIGPGETAVVHYTGWLYESAAPDHKGKKFDSSLDRNEPFRFHIGAGEVIQGWDQGVQGMKAGGKRRLTIPAPLAYGDRGAGGVIPPGATLVFDIELLSIENQAPAN